MKQGKSVVIRDRKVLESLPGRRVERVGVWARRGKKGERMARRERRESREEEERREKGGLGKMWEKLWTPLAGGTTTAEKGEGECGCEDDESEQREHAAESEVGADGAAQERAKEEPYELHLPALAASFGPSLTAPPPPPLADGGSAPFLILDGEPLPLVLPPYSPYGCEVQHPPPSPSPLSPSPSSSPSDANSPPPPSPPLSTPTRDHLLLLHRGQCSFALKSHFAALSGAKGVVLISSHSDGDHPPSPPPSSSSSAPHDPSVEPPDDQDGFVVPSASAADEGEETMKVLVPMVLVGNSTGSQLEEMVRAASAQEGDEEEVFVSVHEDEDEEYEEEELVSGLVLGGYVVRNVKLYRGRDHRGGR